MDGTGIWEGIDRLIAMFENPNKAMNTDGDGSMVKSPEGKNIMKG